MRATLEHVANDPPTYAVRIFSRDEGDHRFYDRPDVGVALVQVRNDLAAVKMLFVPERYDREAREAIRVALKEFGIGLVRAARVREGHT